MEVAARQRPAPGDLCLDHLGHFVPDLDEAARLLDALGLAFTPVSHHQVLGKPAGTANRCVMLEQGYLEILAPTLDTPNAARVRANMARYRGVHLACLGTPDAEFEHGRLAAHGFEPEPLVNLERTLDTGEVARFKVIYVPPEKMPEGRVQYCEQLTPEHVWKPGYVNALSLQAVYVVSEDPAATAARWGRFGGLLPRPEKSLVRLDTARGSILISTREQLSRLLGEVPPAPAIAGYALGCADPDALIGRCRARKLKVRRSGKRHVLALPPALGSAWVLTA